MRKCLITTCVGRWRFLEQAYSTWCRHLGDTYSIDEVLCVTSDKCCDVTGVKAKQLGMKVEYVDLLAGKRGVPVFHKTRMLNEGAHWAIREGYETLLLLDADTMVLPGFAEQLALVPEQDHFAFCSSPLTKRDLAGVLVVNAKDWMSVGGMDESFVDWGSEDLDMRLRLFLSGRSYVRLNPFLLQPLSHSDELRVEFREEKNKYASLERNNALMAETYFKTTGRQLTVDLVESVTLREIMGLSEELGQMGKELRLP